MQENEKEFCLDIMGEKVLVSKDIYLAFVRPERAEQRRRSRQWRCRVVGPKGNFVRCTRNCAECKYAQSGKSTTGNYLSLEGIKEAGIEIEDKEFDMEANLIEREEKQELHKRLFEAIALLTPRQQEVVRLIYLENKSQAEVASSLNITQGTVSITLERAINNLRNLMKK